MKTSNVVKMSDRFGMRSFPACQQVEAYWEALCSETGIPHRSAIDPRGIEDALNFAFILETIGKGHARVRIAGLHLNEVMGFEFRGMPLSSMINVPSRDAFRRALTAVTSSPAKMELSLEDKDKWGMPPLRARMVLLPLQNDDGEINRILGCFETFGSHSGARHRRFDLKEARKTPVDSLATGAKDGIAAFENMGHFAAQPAQASAFAEPEPTRYSPPSKERSYLRLVKSGEDDT